MERKAPGVITRESVTEPMLTGYKIIDALLPIGRGQRELIIGDRQTGKTTIAIDTILIKNISMKMKLILLRLCWNWTEKKFYIKYSNFIKQSQCCLFYYHCCCKAADSASLQFIAPYTGCAIAEYYRDKGEHALIIYEI